MIKIIDGKSYNTETSEKLAEYWNGCSRLDFRFMSEDLYKTKKGQFFIAGEGGAMTKYSKTCGNMRCSGEHIDLLSEAEAREWIEQYANDKYLEIFDVEEG